MNDELRTALRELVLAAGPNWSTAIENCLANSKTEILAIRPGDQDKIRTGAALGGRPLMAPAFDWPGDRAGQRMQFLLQVDLKNIVPPQQYGLVMPQGGRLTVFRSAQILTMPDKDRRAFQLTFEQAAPDNIFTDHIFADPPSDSPGPPLLPALNFSTEAVWSLDIERLNVETLGYALPQNFSTALLHWAQKYNLYTCADGYFFGGGRHVEEEKEICAFAAGGISWDATRARDSHYSHLTALKDNWILLARIKEESIFKSDTRGEKKISYSDILIQKEDLAQGLFERAWLLSR